MALWGGRYKLEDTSVTRRDFPKRGPGLRADIPLYPPGVFVGKQGRLWDESTARASFPTKVRVESVPCRANCSFTPPRPLLDHQHSAGPHKPESSRTDLLDSTTYWPSPPPPEWQLPPPRLPYPQSSNLEVGGENHRFTSTYTEDLGHVRTAEAVKIITPAPGLVSGWGKTQQDTAYEEQFSAELIRHPECPQLEEHATRVRAGTCKAEKTCPRWQTSYTAQCLETLEAPNWIMEQIYAPRSAPACSDVAEGP